MPTLTVTRMTPVDNRILATVELLISSPNSAQGKLDDAERGKIQSIGKEASHDPIM